MDAIGTRLAIRRYTTGGPLILPLIHRPHLVGRFPMLNITNCPFNLMLEVVGNWWHIGTPHPVAFTTGAAKAIAHSLQCQNRNGTRSDWPRPQSDSEGTQISPSSPSSPSMAPWQPCLIHGVLTAVPWLYHGCTMALPWFIFCPIHGVPRYLCCAVCILLTVSSRKTGGLTFCFGILYSDQIPKNLWEQRKLRNFKCLEHVLKLWKLSLRFSAGSFSCPGTPSVEARTPVAFSAVGPDSFGVYISHGCLGFVATVEPFCESV